MQPSWAPRRPGEDGPWALKSGGDGGGIVGAEALFFQKEVSSSCSECKIIVDRC